MVGDRVWLRGDQVTITSDPYELYGKQFVNVVDANGKQLIMMTPAQVAENITAARRVWVEQQAGFKRLHDSAKMKE